MTKFVHEQTGILLSANLSEKEIFDAITHLGDEDKRISLRVSSGKFWKNNFPAEEIYNEFYTDLVKVFQDK